MLSLIVMIFSFQEKISDLAAHNEKRQFGSMWLFLQGNMNCIAPLALKQGSWWPIMNGSVQLELNRLEFEKAAIRPSTLMPMSAVNWNCMSVYAAVTMAGQLLAVCCPAVLLQN